MGRAFLSIAAFAVTTTAIVWAAFAVARATTDKLRRFRRGIRSRRRADITDIRRSIERAEKLRR